MNNTPWRLKTAKKERESKPLNVRLVQAPGGQWTVIINQGKPMPATDIEVALWLKIQKLEKNHVRN